MAPPSWTERHVVPYLAVYYYRTVRRIYRNAAR